MPDEDKTFSGSLVLEFDAHALLPMLTKASQEVIDRNYMVFLRMIIPYSRSEWTNYALSKVKMSVKIYC